MPYKLTKQNISTSAVSQLCGDSGNNNNCKGKRRDQKAGWRWNFPAYLEALTSSAEFSINKM